MKSILKSIYHDVGPFCNLFVTSLQLILFCFNARICLFTCLCFFKWTVYSLRFTSYHFKLTMLLSNEKEVTKVPHFSSRERERERERMTARWLTVCAAYHVTKLGIITSSEFNGLQTKNTISVNRFPTKMVGNRCNEKIGENWNNEKLKIYMYLRWLDTVFQGQYLPTFSIKTTSP